MRPLAVLIGIIMGSAVSVAIALSMTAIVFLFLPEYQARIEPERIPLYKGLAWSWSLAVLAAAGFVGELRRWRWRLVPQLLLLGLLMTLAWIYWPR